MKLWAQLRRRPKLVTGLAVLAVIVVPLLVERYRGVIALRYWQRQMRAQGEKLTVAELTPATPTNPAVRVYTPAGLQSALGGFYAQRSFPTAMSWVAPGKARCVSLLASWTEEDGLTNDWNQVASLVEPSRASALRLRADLEAGVFLQLDLSAGFSLLLPHLASIRATAQTLATTALVDLHAGRLDEALTGLTTLVALDGCLARDPLVIGQLVRLAVAAIGSNAIWEALQNPGWNDAQLARLQELCRPTRVLEGFVGALRMERAMGDAYYEDFRRRPSQRQQELGMVFGRGPWGGGAAPIGSDWFELLSQHSAALASGVGFGLWGFTWSHQDQWHYDRAMQGLIESFNGLAAGRLTALEAARTGPRLMFAEQSGYDRIRCLVCRMLLPSHGGLVDKALNLEAFRALALTATALKRHQLRTGRPAPSLEALAPDLLPQVPRDPYDSKPLRYRLTPGGGFWLYSIGKDGKDNGGDGESETENGRGFYSGRDLVWPLPASAEELRAGPKRKGRR